MIQQFTWTTILSYGTGALLFGMLSVLLLTNWHRRLLGTTFAVVCIINALWLTLLAAWPALVRMPWQVAIIGEALRDGAWLYLLARLLRSESPAARRTNLALQWAAIAAPLVWVIGTLFLPAHSIIGSTGMGPRSHIIGGGLILAIAMLFMLEQFWHNLVPEKRWSLKFLAIGAGMQFAYDVLLYSQALLYHEINPSLWSARGVIAALSVPLLAVAASRSQSLSGELIVSRRIVFHTAVLLSAGIYLLFMAAGGYYIRYLGGTWGDFGEVIFLFTTATLLATLLISGQVRARIKVFLGKHFHAYKYDYRDEWSRLIHQLYRTNDTLTPYERATHALADIVDSPGGALLSRHDTQPGYTPAAIHSIGVNGSVNEPADSPMTTFMRKTQWIIDADTLETDRIKYPELELAEWVKQLRNWWLIVPLMLEQELLGFIVLAHSRAPRALNWEDRDLLKAAAQQLAAYLAQHQDSQALLQARQFQAFNQLSTFLMHDLKNLIAQQRLMVENAVKHKGNPAFVDDMIATVDNSVQRMTRLMEQLRGGRENQRNQRISVLDTVQTSLVQTADRTPRPRLEYGTMDTDARITAEPYAFSMVLQHVIRNAQDSTPNDGDICVKITISGDNVLIDVIDSGNGMTPEFVRERLFTPFDSTKASRGMGIGAYQARTFARQHGGDVEVDSAPGRGTRFTLRLPLAQDPAHPTGQGAPSESEAGETLGIDPYARPTASSTAATNITNGAPLR